MKTKSINNKETIITIVSAVVTFFIVSHFIFKNWETIKGYIFG